MMQSAFPGGSNPVEVVHARRMADLSRLRRVRDRLDREYGQALDVEELARDTHMSAGHLSLQFRLAYGQSPYSYLMTRRMERAAALLRSVGINRETVITERGAA